MQTDLQVPRDPRPHAVHRRDPMVRVRIRCRTQNQVIPGGYVLPQGETTCLVYAPDLPAIEAMVEREPGRIAEAEGFFMRTVEEALQDELRDLSDPDSRRARLGRGRDEFSGSLEGSFRTLFKRDILPLESVEVLEKDIPAPVQAQTVEQQSFLAQTIASAVSSALAATLPSLIAAVQQGMNVQPQAQQHQQTKKQ